MRIHTLILEDSLPAMLDLRLKLNKLIPSGVIHCAKNYEEAVAICESVDISLAFVDLSMPKKNGMDFILDYLKTNPLTVDIPVIVVSGIHERSFLKQALEGQVHRYFQKPVRFQLLAQVIDSICRTNMRMA